MNQPLLKVNNIEIVFGGLKAVEDFSIEIFPNEIVGLIGPNGAGKTTVFNMLTGVYHPNKGEIIIAGSTATKKMKPHHIVSLGLARTFQNIRLFKQMSVLENVMVAYNQQMKTGFLTSTFRFPRFYMEEEKYRMHALSLLKIFKLDEYAALPAQNLPYGKQRCLEIARAIATNPKVLLLDEPAAGMNPNETMELMETIRYVRDNFNIAILLIEHDMNLVMNICDRISVLEYGKLIASGTPDVITNNPRVIEAYLGGELDD